MRNMWSCPDTQSEETQSLTPSLSPPSFSLPPFLPFFLAHSLSLHSLLFTSLKSEVSIKQHCFQTPLFLCVSLSDIPNACPKLKTLLFSYSGLQKLPLKTFFFSLLYQNKWPTVSRKNILALFLADIHPCSALTLSLSQTCLRDCSTCILLGHAMQSAHKETWEERGLSPPVKSDRRSQSFFHVLNSSLASTWIN